MKIAILGQEEPVYFSPFLRKIIQVRSNDMALIVIAGKRSSGSHPKTLWDKLKDLYSHWRLLEPSGFLKHVRIRCHQKLIALLGLIGTKWDQRSLEGIAKQLQIELFYTQDINSAATLDRLKKCAPDVIINQSELILKKELLSIPKIGILNRHASLLPRFRGRLASFWGHAHSPPEYGTTIHFVDADIDSGPIVLQKKYDLDPAQSFEKILDILFKESASLLLEALESLDKPALPNPHAGTSVYRFPTLSQIQSYRKTLAARRKAALTAR